MADITLVGSGASGVHFALTALEKGHRVTMLDVGYSGPAPVNPEDNFNGLKENLQDPVEYFLGKNFESVVPPDDHREIYGFPPNKQYIFRQPPGFHAVSGGFEPLFSFARGGLAQAWTGGSYPLNDEELEPFPIDYSHLGPYYDEVARRIGVMGEDDDMTAYFPLHRHLLGPLRFDPHSRLLADRYLEKREGLNRRHGIRLGRSRVAVLSADLGGRSACDYSGRCLWGCPTGSLYVPALTLEQCLTFPGFTYIPRRRVSHFKFDGNRRITAVVAYEPGKDTPIEYGVEHLVLAAGTLSTAKIYMDSIYRDGGGIISLPGLMDNRQVLVPFITPAMLGKKFEPETYQYHQLVVGFRMDDGDYVHGQITTLKTALMQPVLQGMPLDWKTALYVGRNLHAALAVVNMNYSDTRREHNYLTLRPFSGSGHRGDTVLNIFYTPPRDENKKIKGTLKRVKKFLGSLGAVVPLFQAHTRPMGASVHYSGTLPMTADGMTEKNNPHNPHHLTPNCRSRCFPSLHVVDGSSFPFLPAKNLTFTLMANAARVADREF